MRPGRYRIHDGRLLQRLMRNPGPAGTEHTVRSLARATGLSASKVQRLITEERPTVTDGQATRIAEAVGERRRALFAPTPSPSSNGDHERKRT